MCREIEMDESNILHQNLERIDRTTENSTRKGCTGSGKTEE